MFSWNGLVFDNYRIAQYDVHLHDDKIQININVVFNDKGLAKHPLLISRIKYYKVAICFIGRALSANRQHIAPILRYYKTHKTIAHLLLLPQPF